MSTNVSTIVLSDVDEARERVAKAIDLLAAEHDTLADGHSYALGSLSTWLALEHPEIASSYLSHVMRMLEVES